MIRMEHLKRRNTKPAISLLHVANPPAKHAHAHPPHDLHPHNLHLHLHHDATHDEDPQQMSIHPRLKSRLLDADLHQTQPHPNPRPHLQQPLHLHMPLTTPQT